MAGNFVFIVVLAAGLAVVCALLLRAFWVAKKGLKKYQPIIDIESEVSRLEKEAEKLKKTETNLLLKSRNIRDEIGTLQKKLKSLEDESEIQSFGLYEPKYDFESSDHYKAELDHIRKQQKQMIKDKSAAVCYTQWTVDGSKRKGQTQINEQLKLMLRAFNGECDSLIMKVKYNNINSIERRLEALFKAVNRLGKTSDCEITREYFNLKINELDLVHEFQEKKQEEKEEQRFIKEQIREEERAQREIEKARIKAEKEEERYQRALEKARKDVEKATGKKQARLQAEIERLNELLVEAQVNQERAKSRAEMTRSGYVYVISNIGSFGAGIYKIGMTRRLEPMDRVRELGDASVPFRFDVHAIIFSENAPNLENELHKKFADRRVNMVNNRKEFFRVSLEDIRHIIANHYPEAKFTMTALAEEFRKTQAIQKNGQKERDIRWKN